MPTDPAYPDVPTDQLRDGGWELVDESVETVFQLPTARVEGATKVYDAVETREAVRNAIGLDHQWRFFFATALSFTPPLAPGQFAAVEIIIDIPCVVKAFHTPHESSTGLFQDVDIRRRTMNGQRPNISCHLLTHRFIAVDHDNVMFMFRQLSSKSPAHHSGTSDYDIHNFTSMSCD